MRWRARRALTRVTLAGARDFNNEHPSRSIAFGHDLKTVAEGVADVETPPIVDGGLIDYLNSVFGEARPPGVDVVHDERRMPLALLLRNAVARLDVQFGRAE